MQWGIHKIVGQIGQKIIQYCIGADICLDRATSEYINIWFKYVVMLIFVKFPFLHIKVFFWPSCHPLWKFSIGKWLIVGKQIDKIFRTKDSKSVEYQKCNKYAKLLFNSWINYWHQSVSKAGTTWILLSKIYL